MNPNCLVAWPTKPIAPLPASSLSSSTLASSLTLLVVFGLLTSCLSLDAAANDWPQWRGPTGDGHSDLQALKWDDLSVGWTTELPGVGQSSPVVWGDKIFLTAAEESGAARIVMCLSKKTGKLLWKQTAWSGEAEKVHNMNPWASATCATDGERVVAFFGRGGLHCFSVDGKRLWSRQLGAFENPWGTAASPIIVGDLVIQNCDAEGDSCLAAFNKETGADVWRTPREKLRGWSTPLLVCAGDVDELLLNGETGAHGYDAKTGKELWFRKGDTGRGTPTVTPTADGFYVVVNGRAGDMFAVKADGAEVWRTTRRGGRDLPSPIALGDRLLVVSLRPGMVSTYESLTGKELGRQRLEGSFAASPIVVAGHAVIPNEDGKVFVLKPEAGGVKVVAVKEIKTREKGEIFRASATPIKDGLLVRSTRTLYFLK